MIKYKNISFRIGLAEEQTFDQFKRVFGSYFDTDEDCENMYSQLGGKEEIKAQPKPKPKGKRGLKKTE